jgi:hypothetical protein
MGKKGAGLSEKSHFEGNPAINSCNHLLVKQIVFHTVVCAGVLFRGAILHTLFEKEYI